MSEASEGELNGLMWRLAQGERDAFDPLFRGLYPRALRLARARVAEEHAADVAQSILMKVFSRAPEFEVGKPVLPWFYAVAANEIHTSRRRLLVHQRREVEESAGAELASDDSPECALLLRELRSCVRRAVDALDFESAEAISAMLGEGPRPAVNGPVFRKRVSRAYGRLRLLLGGPDGK